MLTEAEVQRSFRKLFGNREFEQNSFEQAEELLDQLRPESPLRLRLSMELEELRTLSAKKKPQRTAAR